MSSGIGGDRRGSLPYAAVAVVVLMLAASWSAAAFMGRDGGRESDRVMEGEAALDSAADSISAWVERSLGEIVVQVSADPDSGALSDKEALFEELVDGWMRMNFPASDSGFSVTAEHWHISLSSTAMQIGGRLSADGYTPAYLVASGTVDAVFDGSVGSGSRTLDVTADAGSALPLTMERGSLFEAALSGDGSLLSQLMTYQLSGLAQYRVLNGWGASGHGPEGTWSILTRDDVLRSYSSCVSAISSLYLSTGDGGWVGAADAASVFLGEDLTIDLGRVYSDALYGMADDIALKWFDYFGGGSLLDRIDGAADAVASGWETLVGFLTGRDADSAAGYIREVCGDIRYTVHPEGGFVLRIPRDGDGDPQDPLEIALEYPEVDVLSARDVVHFHSIYRDDRNGLREWIRGMVVQAVDGLASDRGLGRASFACAGDEDLSDAMVEAALAAAGSCVDGLASALAESIRSTPYRDQLSSAVWDYISADRDEQLLCSAELFAAEILPRVNAELARRGLDPVSVDDLLAWPSFAEALGVWRADADRLLSDLEPLREVSGRSSSILRDGCIAIIRGGIDLAGMMGDRVPYIERMCREIGARMVSSGFSGVQEYPVSDGFYLASGDGGVFVRMGLDLQSLPDASVRISEERSMHSTGFGDRSVASYETSWDVSLRDVLRCTVTGTDAVSEAAGSGSAVFSMTVPVDLALDVSVVSGLPLADVSYEPTSTLAGDLWAAAVAAAMALIDPLLELLRSMQEVIVMIQEAVAKMYGVAQELLDRMHAAMEGPMGDLRRTINDRIDEALCEGLSTLLDEIRREYRITASQQAVTLSYGGWDLTLVFYLATLGGSTRHIVKATASGTVGDASFTGSLDLKLKGSAHKPCVTGTVECGGEDWSLRGTVDPMMSSDDRMIAVWGAVGDAQVLLELPVLQTYNELDLSLRDIPALSPILSNIPFLIPGTTLSVDAGLDLKYNFPVAAGIMINEIEPNPDGEDRGSEWAEVINLTGSGADISGWTLVTSKGRTFVFPDGTVLGPGGRAVAEFDDIFLLNSSETLALRDASGAVADSVGPFSDGYNDGRTYQRGIDGMADWGMYEGTKGSRNGGAIFSLEGKFVRSACSILGDSALAALSELGGKVTTEDDLAHLIELTLRHTVDRLIDSAASFLVEASAYVEAEVTDLSSSITATGVRVHLSADEDLAKDLLRFAVGNAARLVLGIDDPYGIELEGAFRDDILLGVTVYTGAGLPSVLDPGGDSGIELGIDVSVNIAGLSKALGAADEGRSKIKAGAVAKGLPYSSLPKIVGGTKGMDHDLWAFRLTMTWRRRSRGRGYR